MSEENASSSLNNFPEPPADDFAKTEEKFASKEGTLARSDEEVRDDEIAVEKPEKSIDNKASSEDDLHEEGTSIVAQQQEESENQVLTRQNSAFFPFCDICEGLMKELPEKSKFLREPIKFTCIDAAADLIAVGTSSGRLCIYNRHSGRMDQESKLQQVDQPISALKVLSSQQNSQEYNLIACGYRSGLISLFRLPSSRPGLSRKYSHQRCPDAHHVEISALEWSTDGLKLFSADKSGLAMITYVSFDEGYNCVSSFVCCEDSPVIQLSFSHGLLAVSTLRRAVIVDIADDCNICQIGSTKRSSFGEYGIQFWPDSRFEKPQLITSRPGCRLWVAKIDGKVLQTLLYKDLLEAVPDLPLPTEVSKSVSNPFIVLEESVVFDRKERLSFGNKEFGPLHFLSSNLLATHSEGSFYLLNPERQRIIAKADLRRAIKGVAVCRDKKEIFVLSGDRTVIRVSSTEAEEHLLFAPTKASVTDEAKQFKLKFHQLTEETLSKPKEHGIKTRKAFLSTINKIHHAVDNVTSKPNDIELKGEENYDEIGGMDKTAVKTMENFRKPKDTGSKTRTVFLDALKNIQVAVDSAIVPRTESIATPTDTMSVNSGNEQADQEWFLQGDMEETEQRMTEVKVRRGGKKSKTSSLAPVGELERERSWSDSFHSAADTFVQSVSGFGANVETGEFVPMPIVAGGESPVKYKIGKDSVVVKVKRKKIKRQRAASSEGRKSETDNSSGSPQARTAFPAVSESSDEPLPSDDPINEDLSREEMETLLDSTLLPEPKSLDSLATLKPESPPPPELSLTHSPPPESLAHSAELTSVLREKNFEQLLEAKLAETKQNNEDDLEQHLEYPQPVDTDDEGGPSLTETEEKVPELGDSFDCDNHWISEDNLGGASRLDIWSSSTLDNHIVAMSASHNYICVVDSKRSVRFAGARDPDMVWDRIQESADSIAISPSGHLVWIIDKKGANAKALLRAGRLSPKGFKWIEAASGDISSVSIAPNGAAWYLKDELKVCAQMGLTPERPCYRVERADADWPLVGLTCSSEAVWGLRKDGTLVVRVGVRAENPMGEDWVDIKPEGPSETVSISLFGNTGWCLDVEGRLWFSSGISFRHPFGRTGRWWQVMLPTQSMESVPRNLFGGVLYAYQQLPSLVASTAAGLLLACGNRLFLTRGAVTGHRWRPALSSRYSALDNFSALATGGLFDSEADLVWLLRKNGEFFAFQPDRRKLSSVPPPPTVVKAKRLSSSAGVLWVLDAKGCVFIRSGIDSRNPLGRAWEPLNLDQLSRNAHLTHLSCSLDSVWAVDSAGAVWVRLGRERAIAGGLISAWLPVEPPAKHPAKSIEVSCDGALVWLLSTTGSIWARAGITDNMPNGEGWTEVEGVNGGEIGVGTGVVWALDDKGQLFRRHGVRAENPCGNYWKNFPITLKSISVTPDNMLWALDRNRKLVRHQVKIYRPPQHSADNSPVLKKQRDEDGLTEAIEGFEIV